MTNNFEFLPQFVIRIPLYPLSVLRELTADSNVSDLKLKSLAQEPCLQEAIYLASPQLYAGIQKWINGAMTDKRKIRKVRNSLLKYITRTTSRCTPFGLFAACGVGVISSRTNLIINERSKNRRITRLDMHFLMSLNQDILKDKKIQNKVLFYPNSSLYALASKMRYIEYRYKESRRHYALIEIDNSPVLTKIIKFSKNGATTTEIASFLIQQGVDKQNCARFINELIDNQVLVSELEPSLTGEKSEKQILNILENVDLNFDYKKLLNNIIVDMRKLDCKIGNDPSVYNAINGALERAKISFDSKTIFQTDMFLNVTDLTLSDKIPNMLVEVLSAFWKVNESNEDVVFADFKKRFRERFEEEEMPLALALDSETGLQYVENTIVGEVCPLIDDLFIANSKRRELNFKMTKWKSFFQKKIIENIKSGDSTIELHEADLAAFNENTAAFPDTFSVMIKLLSCNSVEKIKICYIGGTSASNLINRFSYGHQDIHNLVQQITAIEKSKNPQAILAEIIHLPEDRIGNILLRPVCRDYEIPYLGKSSLDTSRQIELTDLMISLKNDRFVLRSKALNVEVKPYLSTAHNYTNNSLPVYHFLCAMQAQDKATSIGANFDHFLGIYSYLPRVEYKNVILSEASWLIREDDVKGLFTARDDEELFAEIVQFKTAKELPEYVVLTENDNELVVVLNNIDSVRMLLDSIKDKEFFVLREFLFEEKMMVTDSNGESFTNEIILSIRNNSDSKQLY